MKKQNENSQSNEQKTLNDKIESYIEDFIKDYNKLKKDNPHMNQGLQSKLFDKPTKKLVERVAIAMGQFSKKEYLTELKKDYSIGDGSMGSTTNAFDESCKKLVSNLEDKPQLSMKSKLYSAVSSIAGKVGLKQVEIKFDEKAKDAQISSNMKSLSSSQKKALDGIKDIITAQKKTSDPKIAMATHTNNQKRETKTERGRG